MEYNEVQIGCEPMRITRMYKKYFPYFDLYIFKITITYTENRISNQMKALIEVKLYFVVRGLNKIKNS